MLNKIILNGNRIDEILFTFILITFSFIIHSFMYEGSTTLYLPQVAIEVICFLYMVINLRRIDNIGRLLIGMVVVCLLQSILNPATFRLTTVAYTMLFVAVFIAYRILLNKRIVRLDAFLVIIKYALILYAIVLLIQQVQSLANLEIFNVNSDRSSKFKLNSLTWESSNLCLIVPAYFISYIKCREIQLARRYNIKRDFKADRLVWLLFLYLQLTCGSMTGFIVIVAVMLYFFKLKNIFSIGVSGIIAMFIVLPMITQYEVFNFDRIKQLYDVIFTLDPTVISMMDASSACRIVPTMVYFQSIDLSDWQFWFGRGVDSLEEISKYLIINDNFDRNIGATNIFAFLYDYGIIAGLLFLVALKRSISSKWFSYVMFLYLAIYSVSPINHHKLWIFLILLSTVKYFESQYNLKKTK